MIYIVGWGWTRCIYDFCQYYDFYQLFARLFALMSNIDIGSACYQEDVKYDPDKSFRFYIFKAFRDRGDSEYCFIWIWSNETALLFYQKFINWI